MLAAPPQDDDFGAWDLLVSARTDMEGWQYGSVFKCAAAPLPQKNLCVGCWIEGSAAVLQEQSRAFSRVSSSKL